jgi:hypothetical protein
MEQTTPGRPIEQRINGAHGVIASAFDQLAI